MDRGRGLRAKCKSLSKTTRNHYERRQNTSVENVFQSFAFSFVSFLRRKHDFRRRIATFVWRILFEEPKVWTSGFNLRTRVLKSVTAAQEHRDMRGGCRAAEILPVGVCGTKNVLCLSSLLFHSHHRHHTILIFSSAPYLIRLDVIWFFSFATFGRGLIKVLLIYAYEQVHFFPFSIFNFFFLQFYYMSKLNKQTKSLSTPISPEPGII